MIKKKYEYLKDKIEEALAFHKEFPSGTLGMMRAFNWLDKNIINQVPNLMLQLQQSKQKLQKIEAILQELPEYDDYDNNHDSEEKKCYIVYRLNKIQSILKEVDTSTKDGE